MQSSKLSRTATVIVSSRWPCQLTPKHSKALRIRHNISAMTTQCVGELEGHLRDMLSLKAPGVTGGKISKITELCNANIQVCYHPEPQAVPLEDENTSSQPHPS